MQKKLFRIAGLALLLAAIAVANWRTQPTHAVPTTAQNVQHVGVSATTQQADNGDTGDGVSFDT